MRVRLCVWVSVFVESKKVASLQISILFYYYFPWPFAIFFFYYYYYYILQSLRPRKMPL